MWHRNSDPLVILAPMDGYTDPPFRRFVKMVAPGIVVFSEFLPAAHVARSPALAKRLFKIYPDEQPVIIQLYGKDPADFRTAAMLAEAEGAAGIDINMGCPAKKVVAHRHGSALMREIDLACEIVASIKSAVQVPVTVKTRLGWEDDSNLIPFVKLLVEAGLDAITVHGRTYSQKFEGEADWRPIYALKQAVTIPVFGNGDIDSTAKAQSSIGNLDGLMVGRAAVADPWLMGRIQAQIAGGQPIAAQSPPFAERLPFWKSFAAMTVDHRAGEERNACHSLRKYLVRLHRELGLDPDLRGQATRVESLDDVNRTLDRFSVESIRAAVCA